MQKTQLSSLTEYLEQQGIAYSCNVSMRTYTTFQIGGPCDCIIQPTRVEEIVSVLQWCKTADIPVHTVGKGSNLLVSDGGVDGVILHLGSRFSQIRLLDETTLLCEAGAPLAKVCWFAYQHGLTGLEFAWGIPGTVGGAAYMNAGAYNGEMKDVLVSCRHVCADGQIGEYVGEALDLSYRHSVYSDSDMCITEVCIKLQKGDRAAIRERMDDLMHRRTSKQPLEYPSAGSTFKRPAGNYASALIEQCGLKGVSVGGAMVSPKHSGFIINTGNASCEDVLALIHLVQRTVYEQTGFRLEPEVKRL